MGKVYGISGGPIDGFREGWATLPFIMKPHYWKREDLSHRYTSLCGLELDQSNYHPGARVAIDPGVFMVERCKRCIRKHARDVLTAPRLKEATTA